ncbi:major histocompatibility complex class I-related gene protein-like [Colossoma macropomum]|uniref:major histocompatibility complex class I-related gene protein-like n=1 Tax=Colossoma macropomum TaxID=42526 RepID=UPI001864A801|nr:major histocompatibility complex class I-related gene protein-like [Colossoma macropomum]
MIDTASVLALLFSFLLPGVVGAFQTPANHSLIYYYTELTKDLSPLGFHEFTALGLLDEWKLYYYDSKNQVTRPEHDWMREGLDVEHLIHNPEELQRLRDWFRRQNEVVGNCTWPCPDLHVLQRRFGCEVKEHENGSVHLLRAIEEYGYDGQDFISFDVDAMQWKAEVPKAQPIKRIWDKEKGRKQHIEFYLKNECVESLSNVLNFRNPRRQTLSPPAFQTSVFAKKSCDKNMLVLTCLVTGFFPKDVKMSVRMFSTSLPEHLLTSSGVRPNEDGTYQLRKSVQIKEDDTDYSCRIEHNSLDTLVTVKRELATL